MCAVGYWAYYTQEILELQRKSELIVDANRIMKFLLDTETTMVVVQASTKDRSYKVIFKLHLSAATGTGLGISNQDDSFDKAAEALDMFFNRPQCFCAVRNTLELGQTGLVVGFTYYGKGAAGFM